MHVLAAMLIPMVWGDHMGRLQHSYIPCKSMLGDMGTTLHKMRELFDSSCNFM
jgi:hypothetical protein